MKQLRSDKAHVQKSQLAAARIKMKTQKRIRRPRRLAALANTVLAVFQSGNKGDWQETQQAETGDESLRELL